MTAPSAAPLPKFVEEPLWAFRATNDVYGPRLDAIRAAIRRYAEAALAALRERENALAEALRGVLPFVDPPYHMDACDHGYVRDSLDEPCPYDPCEDRVRLNALDAAARALASVERGAPPQGGGQS